jgi:hypothetical protein
MVTTVKSNAVYDAIVNLLDTIAAEPDPLNRLVLFQYLGRQYAERVLPERDRATYEARQRYTSQDIAATMGVPPVQVYYWANRHREKTGAPMLPRQQPQDVSGAIDLSARLGIERRRTRKALLPPVVEE